MKREIRVLNARGIHARPSAVMVHMVHGFQLTTARVRRVDSEEWVKADSILGILSLAIACDTLLEFEFEGDQAAAKADALIEWIQNDLFEPDSHYLLEDLVLLSSIYDGEQLAGACFYGYQTYLLRWLASPKISGDWARIEDGITGRLAFPFIESDPETGEILQHIEIMPIERDRFRSHLHLEAESAGMTNG